MLARVHDLLEIDGERFLRAESLSGAPGWVVESLRVAPFVVVRRGGAVSSEHGIAIGVRGGLRHERWAGVCDPGVVRAILTPEALLRRVVTGAALGYPTPLPHAARAAAIPALRTLPILAERWKTLDLAWGPGGSVGFELASGRHVASPQSDLDVVIYAATRIEITEARALIDSAQGLPAMVDIRVETPTCGFSLMEYANRAPAPILLRFADGTVLGGDPWGECRAVGVIPL